MYYFVMHGNRYLQITILVICALAALLIISACGSVVEVTPAALPAASATAVPSANVLPAETATAVPTATRTHEPSATPTRVLATATENPAQFETRMAATYEADFANYQATATAALQALKETVQPRTFQSMQSPDGTHLAEIVIYECTQILPANEMANTYEVLNIDGQVVDEQFLNCGGMGAAGFGGMFWSEDSRFFYYTDAREGSPDGGGPWTRPISRYDTQTGEHESLWQPVYTADEGRAAGGQGTALVVWDFEEGDVARFALPGEGQSWVHAAGWSPDEREAAFAVQECAAGGCDAILMRANLETMQVSELARLPNAQVNAIGWPEPNTIVYFDYNVFNDVIFTLDSGTRATVTPRPQDAAPPTPLLRATPTAFPTYAPEPRLPLERYPFESPFLQPIEGSAMFVMGHGCPSLSGVEMASAPSANDLDPLLDEVRSGEAARLRAASDRAYWPATGLQIRKEMAAWLPSNAAVVPASESPHAEALTRACGPEVVARSWWARINEDSSANQDYFFIRRQGQWLVWNSITTYE